MIELRPSGGGRWFTCHASPFLTEGCARGDTTHADDGTAGHWGAEQVLAGYYPSAVALLGLVTPEGFTITGEMAAVIDVYVKAVRYDPPNAPEGTWFGVDGGVETPVVLALVGEHSVKGAEGWQTFNQLKGTVDAWRLINLGNGRYLLRVFDLKTGWILVEPKNNKQLLQYAGALMQRLGIPPEQLDVELVIVQPRPPHPRGKARTWKLNGPRLLAELEAIEGAIAAICGDDPQAVTGNHCAYCPARHRCPALNAASMGWLTYTGNATPHDMTPQEMAMELGIVSVAEMILKQRRRALEDQVTHHLKQGVLISGVYLSESKGNRAWQEGAESKLRMLAELAGVRPTEEKLLAPVGMEAAGLSRKLIDKYTKRSSNFSLTLGDNSELAKEVFKNE